VAVYLVGETLAGGDAHPSSFHIHTINTSDKSQVSKPIQDIGVNINI